MLFPQSLRRGRLVRRYKRFLADVVFEGAPGESCEETVHVANPGAMHGLAEPGRTIWCSLSTSRTRKLPHSWELVEADGTLVDVNTSRPNRLVGEALATGHIPALAGYTSIRAEVAYGAGSRVDFLLQAEADPPCRIEVNGVKPDNAAPRRLWLEVKGATLSRKQGLAEWPDCVSARGARHLAELAAMVRAGDAAAVLFVVQRSDCDRFAVAADLDPKFAKAIDSAMEAGVQVLVYACDITLASARLGRRIPFL